MAKNSISKISNAFSTGGGGVNFEQQIQAMFLLSLLIDGFCPAMNEQTKKVHFQAKHLGHDVGAMPYSCYDAEELKIIVEKLVVCKRYVTAVNIIGHSECEAVINAGCIYKLMKLAGTEESIGVETLDDYAVQKIIGWFMLIV